MNGTLLWLFNTWTLVVCSTVPSAGDVCRLVFIGLRHQGSSTLQVSGVVNKRLLNYSKSFLKRKKKHLKDRERKQRDDDEVERSLNRIVIFVIIIHNQMKHGWLICPIFNCFKDVFFFFFLLFFYFYMGNTYIYKDVEYKSWRQWKWNRELEELMNKVNNTSNRNTCWYLNMYSTLYVYKMDSTMWFVHQLHQIDWKITRPERYTRMDDKE